MVSIVYMKKGIKAGDNYGNYTYMTSNSFGVDAGIIAFVNLDDIGN